MVARFRRSVSVGGISACPPGAASPVRSTASEAKMACFGHVLDQFDTAWANDADISTAPNAAAALAMNIMTSCLSLADLPHRLFARQPIADLVLQVDPTIPSPGSSAIAGPSSRVHRPPDTIGADLDGSKA